MSIILTKKTILKNVVDLVKVGPVKKCGSVVAGTNVSMTVAAAPAAAVAAAAAVVLIETGLGSKIRAGFQEIIQGRKHELTNGGYSNFGSGPSIQRAQYYRTEVHAQNQTKVNPVQQIRQHRTTKRETNLISSPAAVVLGVAVAVLFGACCYVMTGSYKNDHPVNNEFATTTNGGQQNGHSEQPITGSPNDKTNNDNNMISQTTTTTTSYATSNSNQQSATQSEQQTNTNQQQSTGVRHESASTTSTHSNQQTGTASNQQSGQSPPDPEKPNQHLPISQCKLSNQLEYFELLVGLINARSVNNKKNMIQELVERHKVHILAVVETWLKFNPTVDSSIVPKGFKCEHINRKGRRGGGVMIIYQDKLHIRALEQVHKYTTFEYVEVLFTSTNTNYRFVSLYHPPRNPEKKNTTALFLEEFESYLRNNQLTRNETEETPFILGDFNLCEASQKFRSLLDSFNLRQHVNGPTHQKGRTLDLVITPKEGDFITDVSVIDVDSYRLDHKFVKVKANVKHTERKSNDNNYREEEEDATEENEDDVKRRKRMRG